MYKDINQPTDVIIIHTAIIIHTFFNRNGFAKFKVLKII